MFVTCLQGHFGVQKDQATLKSSNARPVPEHPAGGQLEDDRGGDGRHLQEAAHPQQQGEQLGLQGRPLAGEGRGPGQGFLNCFIFYLYLFSGRRKDQEADEDAAGKAELAHRS